MPKLPRPSNVFVFLQTGKVVVSDPNPNEIVSYEILGVCTKDAKLQVQPLVQTANPPLTSTLSGPFAWASSLEPFFPTGKDHFRVSGFVTMKNLQDGESLWFDVLASSKNGGSYSSATYHVKKWLGATPAPGELHSVSLTPESVVGGNNQKEPALTVYLDGPAKPGGQPFIVSTDNNNLAWTSAASEFVIPAGKSSETLTWFLGTKNVIKERSVKIRVDVNGRTGWANLNLKKK